MAQFDVHRNTGRHKAAIPYVVIVQSSFYEKAKRRVVVPLVARNELTLLPATAINPVFRIEDQDVVLNPLEIVSVPLDALGEKVATLHEESDVLLAALDELFTRAWR
ncbi:MAG: CcdB family protein [Betaproteobacteria bacterium]|nr:CcdB family protein [Betaproteobacteria bacterium]